jgi:hypothetical protein
MKNEVSNLNLMKGVLKFVELWNSGVGGKFSKNIFWACFFQGLPICDNKIYKDPSMFCSNLHMHICINASLGRFFNMNK